MQQIQSSTKRISKRLTPKKIRHGRQRHLVEEADEFLRVGKVGSLVDAAGDISEVDACEGVDFASVAADRESLGDHSGDLYEICGKGRGAVFVDGAERAAVPELRLDNVSVSAFHDTTNYLGYVHSRECMTACHLLLR